MSKEGLTYDLGLIGEVGLSLVLVLAVILLKYVWKVGVLPFYASLGFLVLIVALAVILQVGKRQPAKS
ncbi:MAG: hypothetical protein RXR41_00425 [Candidatus Marsarchaeota archaeon]